MMGGGTGAGAHMWNIVEIDGQYYLADITNSESGTAGYDGSLFLVGTTPDDTVGTTYTFYNENGQATTFVYDEDTLDLWGTDGAPSGILILSESNYPVEEEPEEPSETEPAEGMTQAEAAEFRRLLQIAAHNLGVCMPHFPKQKQEVTDP